MGTGASGTAGHCVMHPAIVAQEKDRGSVTVHSQHMGASLVKGLGMRKSSVTPKHAQVWFLNWNTFAIPCILYLITSVLKLFYSAHILACEGHKIVFERLYCADTDREQM